MKFLNMNMQNFLSVGKAEVNLNDRGLVLIEGKNLDDPSAKSNGAGKSSIVDALCFCLYGKTARGVSGDDVINRTAKKKCFVELRVAADDGSVYTIKRTRKNPESTLTLFKGEQDLTKGTMAETQVSVESLIGCPYDVFVAVVYAGQDAMPDLPSMNDRSLKELIEKIIGVQRLSDSYVLALNRLNNANGVLDEARKAYEKVQNAIEYSTNTMERVEVLSSQWLEERQRALQNSTNEYEEAVKNSAYRHSVYQSALARGVGVDEELAAIKQKLSDFDVEEQKIDTVRRRLNQMEMENNKLSYEAQRHTNTVNEMREDLLQLDKLVGTPCSECGKLYRAEDLESRKVVLTAQMSENEGKAESLRQQFVQRQSEINEKKAALERIINERPKAVDLNSRQMEIHAIKEEITRTKYASESATRQSDSLAVVVEHLKEEIKNGNPFLAQVEQLKKEIKEYKAQLAQAREQVVDAEKGVSVAQKVKELFGVGGVRQHILETITPVLNERTARYLDILSDGKLKAVWSTLTMTKTGVVKEKFNIEVMNTVGGGSFESLSGGEKRKVRLACCLALQELVASRASKPIDLFIADEVDHALDEAGVERLIGVLNEKARVCKTLLVISHNPLRNWIDNYITIVKHNGVSEIEEC